MGVKALAFDVGGTLFDWHTGIADELARVATERGWDADAARMAVRWRTLALAELKRAPEGDAVPRPNADAVHAATLGTLLDEFGCAGATEADRVRLVRRWHALAPWPDVVSGLSALRERYAVVALSLLNTSLVVDLSRSAGVVWDAVFSCEMIGVYKPAPQAYRTAVAWLGLEREQVAMVACHSGDLRGASAAGLRTAFVPRPDEWGPGPAPEPPAPQDADVSAPDCEQLRTALAEAALA